MTITTGASSTIYLVSGSNRGIGLAFVQHLAKDSNVVVYAGARNPDKANELQALAKEHPNRFFVVRLDSQDAESSKAVAGEIQNKFGRVDIVISNAGISNYMGSAAETPADQMRAHYEVNVIGALYLFQAMYPLLKASKSPKFIPVSAAAASSSFAGIQAEYTCYASSKAALNFMAQKIHHENPWLVCFPYSPGVVTTDMAILNRKIDNTQTLGALQDQIAISPEECATKSIDIISKASREEHGGKFVHVDGTVLPW